MGFAAFTFVVIFLLIASGGLSPVLPRGDDPADLRRHHASRQAGKLPWQARETGSSLGTMVEQFETRHAEEPGRDLGRAAASHPRRLSQRLRGQHLLWRQGRGSLSLSASSPSSAESGATAHSSFTWSGSGLGFLLPDFWLGNRISARQARIRRGLPDVLDLLVICIEAGLSLDQATARTAEELELAQPAICDELGIVVLEQRAGLPRADAWRNFCRTHRRRERAQPLSPCWFNRKSSGPASPRLCAFIRTPSEPSVVRRSRNRQPRQRSSLSSRLCSLSFPRSFW